MTYLEEKNTKKKNHAILVEKLAFLLDFYDMLGCNMLEKAVEKWNKEDIKKTQYGKELFKCAERLSRLSLREG